MKYFQLFIIAIELLGNVIGIKKGSKNSFSYLSDTTPFNYSKFKDIIIFGDSYSTVSVDFETMEYTGENYAGGKNWPQVLIDLLPMKMWNFAIGGACVDLNIVEGYPEYTPMTDQYNWFIKNMSTGKKFNNWKGDSSLFVIWFGINDIYGKKRDEELTSSEIDEQIASSMFNMVEGMYEQGGRNFMFIYVPPVEKSPAYPSGYLHDIYENDIPNYNNNLNKYAKNFQSSHPDTNVLVYDAYSEFDYIQENKSYYGITNFTDTCNTWEDTSCDFNNYFWSDPVHPTVIVHKILAQDIDYFLKLNDKSLPQENVEDDCWSMILGYPCCSETISVFYSDESGDWGIENDNWCGIPKSINNEKYCWAQILGYNCCSTENCKSIYYSDSDGRWSYENDKWCGITSANKIC